jgi:hypothetical protein
VQACIPGSTESGTRLVCVSHVTLALSVFELPMRISIRSLQTPYLSNAVTTLAMLGLPFAQAARNRSDSTWLVTGLTTLDG